MKLASYRDGSRDGQLIVVSRDLASAHYASGIAGRLQQVLDDWNFLSPQLEELSQTLNHGKARHAFAFEPAKCLAPLPRVFQLAAADPLHARPAQWPGDALLGAHDSLALGADDNTGWHAGLAAITGDLAHGSTPEAGLEGIRLLMLANRVAGACAFAPLAVTPDELGAAWQAGHALLEARTALNGRRIGSGLAGDARPQSLGALIAALCRTRAVRAGSVVVGDDVSTGPLLSTGDRLQIDLHGSDGGSVFGATVQTAVAWSAEAA